MQPQSAQPDTSEIRTIQLDTEHTGIRLLLPVLTVAAFALGFFLSSAAASVFGLQTISGCLAFGIGIAAALIAAVVADRALKRYWPSGRILQLSEQGLVMMEKKRGSTFEAHVDWRKRFSMLTWRFTVSRGSARVPKGWLMLGLQITQDEAQILLYSFLPLKQAEQLPGFAAFTPLTARSALEKGDLSLRETSEQRRLLRAEDERWRGGAEVRREDFPVVMAALNEQIQTQQRQNLPHAEA